MLTEKWKRAVTHVHENSRYPRLAWAVLFPILLLIICKEKNKPQIILLCVWASMYWTYSWIPYGASQSPSPFHEESRGSDWEKGCSATFVQGAHYLVDTHSVLSLQKYLAWIYINCTVNMAWLASRTVSSKSFGSEMMALMMGKSRLFMCPRCEHMGISVKLSLLLKCISKRCIKNINICPENCTCVWFSKAASLVATGSCWRAHVRLRKKYHTSRLSCFDKVPRHQSELRSRCWGLHTDDAANADHTPEKIGTTQEHK